MYPEKRSTFVKFLCRFRNIKKSDRICCSGKIHMVTVFFKICDLVVQYADSVFSGCSVILFMPAFFFPYPQFMVSVNQISRSDLRAFSEQAFSFVDVGKI